MADILQNNIKTPEPFPEITDKPAVYSKSPILVNSQGRILPTSSLGDVFRFGGDGSDGILTIHSGTTTIDLNSAQVVVKNYKLISIVGTGALTFSNPHDNGTIVVLKSQGHVNLTSSAAPLIDCSGLGGKGGAAITGTTSTGGSPGTSGLAWIWSSNFGGAGLVSGGSPATGGAIATALSTPTTGTVDFKYKDVFIGGGGGSGGISESGGGHSPALISGAGGRGGGALIIECAGAWNFTTASGISVAGQAGSNGSGAAGGVNWSEGGGGGGGGGCCKVLYNRLRLNTGTITINGGALGTGAVNGSAVLYLGGAGGGSYLGGNDANSTNRSGGAGANGFSLVTQNTEFA